MRGRGVWLVGLDGFSWVKSGRYFQKFFQKPSISPEAEYQKAHSSGYSIQELFF